MSPKAEAAPASPTGPSPDAARGGDAVASAIPGRDSSRAGDPEEIELKLAVEAVGRMGRLIRNPPPGGIAGFEPAGPPLEVTCVDRYYDTAALDGRLRLAGLRARLREQDGEVTLGVKGSISQDGAVSRRMELEGPATRDADPLAWPPSVARDRLIAALAGGALMEIAAVRQRRLQRDFARDGTVVEISLDRMSAIRGRRVLERRVELEAELHAGDPALLQPLAAALEALPGMGPARGSKLAFALAAREGTDGARTQ